MANKFKVQNEKLLYLLFFSYSIMSGLPLKQSLSFSLFLGILRVDSLWKSCNDLAAANRF
ncbi:MAG: hypothetical protein A2785_03650 [Candidatus Chisholmbacteria bacterium RIFCSPHIGHO2_01_FULL_49_18]|uniref:Uncharacterized protein n=2 Tax=Candidatus Chisholmiibacteriota TaxID=1817900 RepID=A0A1G1VNB5_9BACT|nr:MAG: hypothetical protein A2785_03650 [Candidatus Chisholmbacteria bacterium RIFCSPHIGHO2_01_FULL_49_18]OGY19473.1 MAG: hypothetical protein A3A65_06210 [Candidatus Chisholmbacteria bacterium RIFCSPLOWO2_01_FULL_49_14]